MAYDEILAGRLRKVMTKRKSLTEMKMFGGLAIMDNGHMCCGVLKDDLIARVDPARTGALLAGPNVRAMDLTGKPMKGFVVVGPQGTRTDEDLQRWVDEATSFVSTLPPKSPKRKKSSTNKRR